MALKLADSPKTSTARFAEQAAKLSLRADDTNIQEGSSTAAAEALFVTPRDPVIQTSGGERLPAVPLHEALKLNRLKEELEAHEESNGVYKEDSNETTGEYRKSDSDHEPISSPQSDKPDASFRTSIPPSRTHPLFPQLPLYGPPSILRNIQSFGFRCTSSVLSLAFLGTIVLGSIFTSVPLVLRYIGYRLTFRDPNSKRPFFEEEKRRKKGRNEEARAWYRKRRWRFRTWSSAPSTEEGPSPGAEYEPTEGGKDPLICDIGYYARRVGLDSEEFQVQTEDGFILTLWHLYNPEEHTPSPASQRTARGPVVFSEHSQRDERTDSEDDKAASRKVKYPVLLVPGLLQSAGAYCCNDDDSLAFFLCKSGYDVWLGNNRCGFKPQHKLLTATDPRMWNWNIRQMGVMDLPALVSRVLSETGFEKLGLICHSQGTTETFVALAKEQRPDLGNRISVFCALAPAVYAGPLIGKMYFKFMRIISPGMFRLLFGIHAFIPFMMTMHKYLPGKLYGALGYRVFSFLFNWTDERWDRGIRDRFFQFSPVYVSAESMRWWLGRECFATQKCILATREEGQQEEQEDEEEGYYVQSAEHSTEHMLHSENNNVNTKRIARAWYDTQAPPFALWVPGSDQLVDGFRLLRRLEHGREPHVRLVHTKIIEEYEHLDVLWAIDAVDQVAKEVREVLWKTAPTRAREMCRVPQECEGIAAWQG